MKYEIRSQIHTIHEQRLIIEDSDDSVEISFMQKGKESLKLGKYSKEEIKRLARSL